MLICGRPINRRLNIARNAVRHLRKGIAVEQKLVSYEFNALKRFTAFVSEMAYFQKDLEKRWPLVENGAERIQEIVSKSAKLFNEMLDTIPANQLKSLRNTTTDLKIAIVPRLAPDSKNIVIEKTDAKKLVDLAQEQCKYCSKTPEEAKDCPIYIVSESVVPPDRYTEFLCPYANSIWAD